jgi:hypothetical protein
LAAAPHRGCSAAAGTVSRPRPTQLFPARWERPAFLSQLVVVLSAKGFDAPRKPRSRRQLRVATLCRVPLLARLRA